MSNAEQQLAGYQTEDAQNDLSLHHLLCKMSIAMQMSEAGQWLPVMA